MREYIARGNYSFNNGNVKILANGEEIGILPEDATFYFDATSDYIPATDLVLEGTISLKIGNKTSRKFKSLARRLSGGKRK